MRARVVLCLWMGITAFGGAGCKGDSTTPPAAQGAPLTTSASATAEAQEIFSTRCQACHGPEGHGDGPASSGLNPPPRNFGDPAWQQSVTDEHIERIIVAGGAGVGLSAGMPNNPDLRARPEVVTALRVLVRGLASP